MPNKHNLKQNVVLPGSERPAPPGAQSVGDADQNESTQLTITVRRRAPIPETSTEQLSRREFAARYGADPVDLKAVADYCVSQGLSVMASDAGRRSVIAAGNLGQASAAFEAEVAVFQKSGQAFRARSGVLTVPAELDGVIEGIFGFDQRKQAHTHFRRVNTSVIRPLSTAQAVSYSPLDVAQAYSFPPGDGTGQTIGIVELGGGYSQNDLDTFFSGINISPSPAVTAIPVDGASNSPSGDPNSADGEVELDIEVAGSYRRLLLPEHHPRFPRRHHYSHSRFDEQPQRDFDFLGRPRRHLHRTGAHVIRSGVSGRKSAGRYRLHRIRGQRVERRRDGWQRSRRLSRIEPQRLGLRRHYVAGEQWNDR